MGAKHNPVLSTLIKVVCVLLTPSQLSAKN